MTNLPKQQAQMDDQTDLQQQQINKYWPIYKDQFETNDSPKFWNDLESPDDEAKILIESVLYRIGRKKQIPMEYSFSLHTNGLLQYRLEKEEPVKGYIELDHSYFVKFLELKSQSQTNPQASETIKALRLKRNNNSIIYIWSDDEWLKLIQKFCISQNFDLIYNLGDMIGRGGFAKVFKVTPSKKLDFLLDEYAAKVYTKEILVQKKEIKKFNVGMICYC